MVDRLLKEIEGSTVKVMGGENVTICIKGRERYIKFTITVTVYSQVLYNYPTLREVSTSFVWLLDCNPGC